MAWSKKDPRKGQKKAHTWTCHHPKGAWTLKAWLAGPPEWVLCHFLDRHVPCHHEMSDGELKCPYCHHRPRTDWIGYTPVYAASGKPLVVMLREYSRDIVSKLELHAAVLVSRGEERYDEVTLIPHRWSDKYVPGLPHRKGPADIRDWLLTLWKDAAWAEWCRRHSTAVTIVSPPDSVPDDRGTGNPLLDRIERDGICRVLLGDDVGDDFKRAAAESAAARQKRRQGDPPTTGEIIPPPTKNGTGKH